MRRPIGSQGKTEHFLAEMANQYGIRSRGQLMNIFDQVSKSRNDLMEYMQSNGQKQGLLWTTDEDELLKKHYKTPQHSLMKLLTRLKTRERVERRKQYLFLI